MQTSVPACSRGGPGRSRDHLAFETVGRLGTGVCSIARSTRSSRAKLTARGALTHMALEEACIRPDQLAVVVEHQLVFVWVAHDDVVTNGSSAARIFRTARKMLCLVALVRRLSVCPISSIDMPSK